ncbi:MAG: MFS transporter [Bacillota bacterium]
MFKQIARTPKKVWLLTLGHVVVDFPSGALLIALPFFMHKFQLDYTEIALVPMIFNIVGSVTQPFFGFLSDRRRVTWRMPLGCILTALGLELCLSASSFNMVLLFVVISGLGSAIFHPEGAKCANHYSGENKGKGAGTFVVGGFVGSALGSLAMGFVLQHSGYLRLIFIIPALLLFFPLLNAARKIPALKRVSGTKLVRSGLLFSLILVVLVLFTRSFIASGLSTFVPLYLVVFHKLSEEFSGTVLSVVQVAGMFGTYIGGLMNDKYGSRMVALCSILPATLLIYLFKSLPVEYAIFFLMINGFLLAASWTSLMVLAQKIMPNNVATASAITMGFSMGMGAVAVVLLGMVADNFGVSAVFSVIMFLPILAFGMSWFIKER